MGLFDWVHVEPQGDFPELPPGEYQTKDLDSLLDHYTLGTDGRLYRDGGGPAEVDDDSVSLLRSPAPDLFERYMLDFRAGRLARVERTEP